MLSPRGAWNDAKYRRSAVTAYEKVVAKGYMDIAQVEDDASTASAADTK